MATSPWFESLTENGLLLPYLRGINVGRIFSEQIKSSQCCFSYALSQSNLCGLPILKISRTFSSRVMIVTYCLLTASLNVAAEEAKRIEDNSFLIEEAYNQEEGVVQYIQSYQYSKRTKNWNYT